MASFEVALYTELSSISGFTAKVFPLFAPEGTAAPYMTYEPGIYTLDKAHNGFLSSGSQEVTVDILAATFSSLKTASDAVVAKIRSFLARSIGTGGPTIQNVTIREQSPLLYEPNVDLYRRSIVFTIYY